MNGRLLYRIGRPPHIHSPPALQRGGVAPAGRACVGWCETQGTASASRLSSPGQPGHCPVPPHRGPSESIVGACGWRGVLKHAELVLSLLAAAAGATCVGGERPVVCGSAGVAVRGGSGKLHCLASAHVWPEFQTMYLFWLLRLRLSV